MNFMTKPHSIESANASTYASIKPFQIPSHVTSKIIINDSILKGQSRTRSICLLANPHLGKSTENSITEKCGNQKQI